MLSKNVPWYIARPFYVLCFLLLIQCYSTRQLNWLTNQITITALELPVPKHASIHFLPLRRCSTFIAARGQLWTARHVH
ncbi:hypothetical protein V1507DRAFT_467214 [Lipomyces tetrasporus]